MRSGLTGPTDNVIARPTSITATSAWILRSSAARLPQMATV